MNGWFDLKIDLVKTKQRIDIKKNKIYTFQMINKMENKIKAGKGKGASFEEREDEGKRNIQKDTVRGRERERERVTDLERREVRVTGSDGGWMVSPKGGSNDGSCSACSALAVWSTICQRRPRLVVDGWWRRC
ncbi:hypothetical protein U1Q18_000530 [Sarracenia purpurea var. burkii]